MQYRERFAEPMEQTFKDLLRERVAEKRELFGFTVWLFVDTLAGTVRENIAGMTKTKRALARVMLVTASVLLVPVVAMQFSDEWQWDLPDFVFLGALLVGAGFTYELIVWKRETVAYRAAVGVAVVAALLLVVVNGAVGIIGDPGGANLMYIGVLAVAVIGTLIARLQPIGMARAAFATALAHFAVAVVALVLGLGAEGPIWPWDVVRGTGIFAILWLGSALLFRRSAPTSSPARVRTLLIALLALTLGAPGVGAQTGAPDIERLDEIAGAAVREDRVVGLVAAVVRANDVILMNAYGRADIESDLPMGTDVMFEVGSIAKQFTAAAILQLRDAGRLSLDDEIVRWLPELGTSGRSVTLRRLLSHTSGIHNFTETPEFESNYFTPGPSRDSAFSLIQLEPFQFPAGRAQAYSNSGFWLLGLIVERASGMKFEDYLREHVFEPLGMTRSMYCDTSADVPRRARGYRMLNGEARPAPTMFYTWVFAPGAVCSTAEDLVTWLQALHGGRFLSAASYAEMTTPATLADGTELQYGMGIKVGEDVRGLRYIGHGGSAPGFRADATWYPDGQLAVIVLANSGPANLDPAELGGALAREVLGMPHPASTTFPGDPGPLVGTYRQVMGGNDGSFVLDVTATSDGLVFSRNGSRPAPLRWAGGLKFYATPTLTLTFRRTDGTTGPPTELRGDAAGNHFILERQ
jgi:CubicO group peptidase (beta-lactamase class C family)